ncbi:MAG TPA: hypothetical protein PLP99_01090 [Ignavibacteriales bacterium]|nr:hypothetical protein [Ignavibacteriales bacterium]HOL80342.1 hypothetical protein [Ignavibacteriales bacterium]HPP32531.1 hypothetical protein [Ignavibacteriales bacterium]
MAFYPMPNDYECGPFSLKYAMGLFGIFAYEKDISVLAGTSWWGGTDEFGLTRAARNYGFKLIHFFELTPAKAITKLNKYLSKYPCILAVNGWNHWITVAQRLDDKYIIMDSGTTKVFNIYNQKQLLQSWVYIDNNTKTRFDGYLLIPKDENLIKAKFKLEYIKLLNKKENIKINHKWQEYYEDLSTICKTSSRLHSISFNEFIDQYSDEIIQSIVYWYGDVKKSELKNVLLGMKIVADVHQLRIKKEEITKAIISITILLTLYACGKHGMVEIY